MNKIYQLKKRHAFLRINIGTVASPNWVTIDGANIAFELQSFKRGCFVNGIFTIYNLNNELIKTLWNRTYQAYKDFEFYVGYGDDVYMIYRGVSLKTTLSMPPDVTMRIESYYRFVEDSYPVNIAIIDYPSLNLETICSICAGKTGRTLVFESKNTKTFDQFYYSGSIKGLFDSHNGAIKNLDSGISVQDNGTELIITDNDNNNEIKTRSKWEIGIGKQLPLIGLPEYNPDKVTITTILNPKIKVLDEIILYDNYHSKYETRTGTAQIIKHIGEVRGNDFLTRITMYLTKVDEIRR